MKTSNVNTNRSGGVDIHAGGDIYIGGDVVGRDKITVFDATAIRWLALGTAKVSGFIRLAGAAILLGLLVAAVSQYLFGGGNAANNMAVTILYGALGALIGGLVAWYSPSLPAALLRVAWIEGGLVAAQWIFSRLVPASSQSLPPWFGLPILHASLLVALVSGPWLALVTYALIRIFGPGSHQALNRRWRWEAIAIVVGCMASGVLTMTVFGDYLDKALPPIDPAIPAIEIPSTIPSDYISGPLPPGAHPGSKEYTRFDEHQDGFIVLPGWLTLSQAVAILISLAMIIPVSAALSAQQPRRFALFSGPLAAVTVGFVVSAIMGLGLQIAAKSMNQAARVPLDALTPYESELTGGLAVALIWGLFGMTSGFIASILHRLLARRL